MDIITNILTVCNRENPEIWRKIGENIVLFLILLGFTLFHGVQRGDVLSSGEVQVVCAHGWSTAEQPWESDYPASLLPLEQINVNTAQAVDLERIPSLGAERAAAIVAHRQNNGDFSTLDGLLDVDGIGAVTLEGMLPYITLD